MSKPKDAIQIFSLHQPGSLEHTKLTDPETGIPKVQLDLTIRGCEDADIVLKQAEALGLSQYTIKVALSVLESVLLENPRSLTAVTTLYPDIAVGTVFVTQDRSLKDVPKVPTTQDYIHQLVVANMAIDADSNPKKHEPLIAIYAPADVVRQLVTQDDTLQLGPTPLDDRPSVVREGFEEFRAQGITQYEKDGIYVTVCPSQGLVVVCGSPGIPKRLAERKPSQD